MESRCRWWKAGWGLETRLECEWAEPSGLAVLEQLCMELKVSVVTSQFHTLKLTPSVHSQARSQATAIHTACEAWCGYIFLVVLWLEHYFKMACRFWSWCFSSGKQIFVVFSSCFHDTRTHHTQACDHEWVCGICQAQWNNTNGVGTPAPDVGTGAYIEWKLQLCLILKCKLILFWTCESIRSIMQLLKMWGGMGKGT